MTIWVALLVVLGGGAVGIAGLIRPQRSNDYTGWIVYVFAYLIACAYALRIAWTTS